MKRIMVLLVCLSIALAGLVGCKNAEVEKEKELAAQKAELAAKKKRKEAQARLMMERKAYENSIASKLKQYDVKIMDMKAKAAKSSGQSKVRMNNAIRDLSRKLREASASLQKLKSSKGKEWNKSKAELIATMNRLDKYYSRAVSIK